ncbi:MAG: hypothetical protein ACKOUM_03475 [Sphingopyxis sp.]
MVTKTLSSIKKCNGNAAMVHCIARQWPCDQRNMADFAPRRHHKVAKNAMLMLFFAIAQWAVRAQKQWAFGLSPNLKRPLFGAAFFVSPHPSQRAIARPMLRI